MFNLIHRSEKPETTTVVEVRPTCGTTTAPINAGWCDHNQERIGNML
jgi:hypothetical protein